MINKSILIIYHQNNPRPSRIACILEIHCWLSVKNNIFSCIIIVKEKSHPVVLINALKGYNSTSIFDICLKEYEINNIYGALHTFLRLGIKLRTPLRKCNFGKGKKQQFADIVIIWKMVRFL